MSDKISHAIEALRSALGTGYVNDSADSLAEIRATFPTQHTVLAIARPSGSEEVSACVRIANSYGVPLYPIS
ncbi:MAG: FAD-binding oxidoreductase, partial [Bacteroidota bacterium]